METDADGQSEDYPGYPAAIAAETMETGLVDDTPSEELSALNTPAAMTPIEEYPSDKF